MPASPATPRFPEVRRLVEIDSTNRYALDAARDGAPDGLVVTADTQTAGRGRLGRTWTAPPGASLLVSVLLRPAIGVERLHTLTMAAAVAMRDAVGEVAGFLPDLKWPNDLLVGDRKLAGLLAEADLGADGDVRAVVVGIGVNVAWSDFPPELADIATACNLVAGRPVDRDALLDAFLARLADRLADPAGVASDYRAGLATLGRRVRVDLGAEVVEGDAVDVDDAGRLLVRVEGADDPVVVAAGDVVHLRPA